VLAIYFMHCNYVRIHQTLRVTPAMTHHSGFGTSGARFPRESLAATLEIYVSTKARLAKGRASNDDHAAHCFYLKQQRLAAEEAV
jgi:hypothetical protein